MKRFLITGLPRSRTAWLSVAATTGMSICHHEPGDGELQSVEEIWGQEVSAAYVGIADAGAGLHLAQILETWAPRTLIVERPVHEVCASATAFVGDRVALDPERMRSALVRLKAALSIDSPLIMRVPFAALNSEAVVRDCLGWLIPGVKPLNLSQLMHLRISSDLGYNVEKLRRSQGA